MLGAALLLEALLEDALLLEALLEDALLLEAVLEATCVLEEALERVPTWPAATLAFFLGFKKSPQSSKSIAKQCHAHPGLEQPFEGNLGQDAAKATTALLLPNAVCCHCLLLVPTC